jgi:hypothetical protein
MTKEERAALLKELAILQKKQMEIQKKINARKARQNAGKKLVDDIADTINKKKGKGYTDPDGTYVREVNTKRPKKVKK